MYIRINCDVNLTSGITVPPGVIVLVAEGFANISNQKDGKIPAQIATSVYANINAMLSNLEQLSGIADFNPVFRGLNLSVSDYETKTAKELMFNAVLSELGGVYGLSNVELINEDRVV